MPNSRAASSKAFVSIDPAVYSRFALFRRYFALCILPVAVIFSGVLPSAAQNVGIGTASPDPSALLDLNSITSGLLVPRMTDAQMLAISPSATGNLVFNTSHTEFYYYSGSAWLPIAGTASAGVLYGPASQQNSLAAGSAPIFNVAYSAATGASVTDAGATILSDASGATAGSANGLTVSAKGSGAGTTATGISVSATGAASDTAVNATGIIAGNDNGIASASTDGLVLQNQTAATSGVSQQFSPRIDLSGSAYNSSGGTSQTDRFIIENQPQTVAGTTTENLVISSSINGGAYNTVSTLSNGGTLTLGSASSTTGALALANSSSSNMTTIQAGDATAPATYTLPTALPTSNGMQLASSTGGALSWVANSGLTGSTGTSSFKRKIADQSNSSTTLTNDNTLFFSLSPNTAYMVDGTFYMNGSAASEEFAMTTSNQVSAIKVYLQTRQNGGSNYGSDTLSIPNAGGTQYITNTTGSLLTLGSTVVEAQVSGLIITGNASTTITLQWAPTGSGKMTVYKNSYMNLLPHSTIDSVFTATSIFVVPTDVSTIYLDGVAGGGGGGGGGAKTSSSGTNRGGTGGGGGAGEYIGQTAITVVPGETLTITIGSGGNAGSGGTTSNTPPTAGGDGGSTTVIGSSSGTIFTANGGSGGGAATNQTAGGAGSAGSLGSGGSATSTPPGTAGNNGTAGVAGGSGSSNNTTVGTGGAAPAAYPSNGSGSSGGQGGGANNGTSKAGGSGVSGSSGALHITY